MIPFPPLSGVDARLARLALLLTIGGVAACGPSRGAAPAPAPSPVRAPITHLIVPAPTSIATPSAPSFLIDSTVSIVVEGAEPAATDARRIADQLATFLWTPAERARRAARPAGLRAIRLVLDGTASGNGTEGYALTVDSSGVVITAATPTGLFYGTQSLRQLLPVSAEHPAAFRRVLRVPAARIVDAPRFEWRGAMLDVSRHFLPATDVKRFVDVMALYKLNRLHLHLADDQGWRIEIKSRPSLTAVGGSSQVGGGAGGFYTQAEYAELVAYAASRYITVIPEIDMPGHTNAALASIADLNCDGKARDIYTGIDVGFSSVCVEREATYAFVADVIRELKALSPAGYFHMGGDEVKTLNATQYRGFVERVESIATAQGMRLVGWGDIAPAKLSASTIVQHWNKDSIALHVARGGRVIASPGSKTYLDMKYDSSTVLGLRWAGIIELRDIYGWDPTLVTGATEASLLGLEAPLWSETITKLSDYEYLAFPRLIAIAELGWSSRSARDWDDFRRRLGAHGPRLQALGVNFYRSPQVDWK